jgi:subtilisin-like proprotein convertase family protein
MTERHRSPKRSIPSRQRRLPWLLALVVAAIGGTVAESVSVAWQEPQFSINDVTVFEGNSGASTAVFTVTLTNPSNAEARVNFATADLSATNTTTLTSVGAITVPATGTGTSTGAPANPYPATLALSGLTGTIQALSVRLNGISHTFPADMDVVLVGPNAQKVVLMSDVGGGYDISGAFLTFRDGFPAAPPVALSSGSTYAPTDIEPGESLPSPAPSAPYATSLAIFNGANPNGTWSLYVSDDSGIDTGSINSFSLIISTSGGDYLPASGQLSFPPGTTTRTVAVTVNGDTAVENNEYFTVNLSSPVNATIVDGQGYGAIVNDDSGSAAAVMATPANASVIANPQSFTWSVGAGVAEYWLSVGTTAGGSDIYYASNGLAISRSVTGIPQDGSTVYVRLWSRLTSGWVYADYIYIGGAGVVAEMVSPTPYSQLTSSTTAFTWTSGTGVTEIWLTVSAHGTLIYNASQGTATSRTLSALPNLSTPLLVRLWSLRNGAWQFLDYVYTSVEHRSTLVLPAVGGTLPGSTATFRWTAGSGVTQRWLQIGTSPGGTNIYNVDQETLLERTISGLPTTGAPLYARLWSFINGGWSYLDYAIRAGDATLASLSSPANGSIFGGSTATLDWTVPAGVTQVWLAVGTAVGAGDIVYVNKGTVTTHNVTGLPTNGRNVYVRLWSEHGGTWKWIDYHFSTIGGVKAALVLPAAGGTLPGATATFRWTTGTGVINKWLFIGTAPGTANVYNGEQLSRTERTISGLPTTGAPLYARLWSFVNAGWYSTDYTLRAADTTLATVTAPAVGSKLEGSSVTFTWNKPAGVTQTWVFIGTTVGGSNLANANTMAATSYAASSLPTNGSNVYLRLWSLQGGEWRWIDYHFVAAGTALVGDDAGSAAVLVESRQR